MEWLGLSAVVRSRRTRVRSPVSASGRALTQIHVMRNWSQPRLFTNNPRRLSSSRSKQRPRQNGRLFPSFRAMSLPWQRGRAKPNGSRNLSTESASPGGDFSTSVEMTGKARDDDARSKTTSVHVSFVNVSYQRVMPVSAKASRTWIGVIPSIERPIRSSTFTLLNPCGLATRQNAVHE